MDQRELTKMLENLRHKTQGDLTKQIQEVARETSRKTAELIRGMTQASKRTLGPMRDAAKKRTQEFATALRDRWQNRT